MRADADQLRAGVYAQDHWELDEQNTLTLGARLDHFGLTNNTNGVDNSEDGASGSFSFLHMFDPKTSAYVTLATGFRSPDLDERYQDATVNFFGQAVTVQGNPDLSPERSYSIDFGVKKESACGDFEVAGYYNSIEDFIGTRIISSNASAQLQRRENVGTVAVYGTEAGWKTSRSTPWRNYANISRSWTDKTSLLSVTNFQVNYGVGYDFPGAGPFTKITPQWMGRGILPSRDTVNKVNFPAWHEADVQVAFQMKGSTLRRTQWVIGVKNIFNTLYNQPFFDQPQPGRGIFTSLQVDF